MYKGKVILIVNIASNSRQTKIFCENLSNLVTGLETHDLFKFLCKKFEGIDSKYIKYDLTRFLIV